MIQNFTIGCPGCRRGIRLRVGIGHETVQRFYFLCPHCRSVVLGALSTDQDRGLIVGLEIDGKPAVWVDDPEAVVTVFTELPIDPGATSMEQFGGSPFLMHHQVLGEPFAEWMTWLDDFTAAIDANWQDIRRWWGYYVRQDWPLFDTHAVSTLCTAIPRCPQCSIDMTAFTAR